MRQKITLSWLLLMIGFAARGQSNNPLSIYEGERIASVHFDFIGLPADELVALDLKTKAEGLFRLYPQSPYNSMFASYYIAQIELLPWVEKASLEVTTSGENGVDIQVIVHVATVSSLLPKRGNIFTRPALFPTLYTSPRTFVVLKLAASEMVYSNHNAWFGQPEAVTMGNPLATHPSGKGYSAWIEGFVSGGVYGITKIIPAINLHLYGGVNYLISFSAGDELFTNRARIFGDIEEAYIGLIGGGRTVAGHLYRYNFLYGRKQFVLGDGWLIINTSMNGDNRAALQLNPRWASKHVFQTGFQWDRLFVQLFRLEANELPVLNSGTVINGANLELGSRDRMLIGMSFLQVLRSRFKYYLPDGRVEYRKGLQVYNFRLFRHAPVGGGLLFKTEVGYQRNPHFSMNAWAAYAEIGWNFGKSYGTPTISYRFAYFSGDDADTHSYNRWDALYTGGNGEQWVQGSNMYKMVQNSNEMSHRLQMIFNPLRKVQLVGQVWFFCAPSLTNLGGNPALSQLKSHNYGTEFNLTIKYFASQHWYFHLNTAYTLPGAAIRDNLPIGGTRNWFCLSAFARYSF
ncbi:MAG: alginate export family protein [Alistipes sp.]